MTRPYCDLQVACDNDGLILCDGCRLEAACNAMGIALALAGLCAETISARRFHGSVDRHAYYAARAGMVLP